MKYEELKQLLIEHMNNGSTITLEKPLKYKNDDDILKRLSNKYGLEEAKERIYVTTDKEKGALKQIADEEGYTTFVIPDNIGGR